MSNKTLNNFKDEVASTFINFDGSPCSWEQFKIKASAYNILQQSDIAAERYANYKAEIAFEEGCEAAMDSYGYCKPIVNPYKTSNDA